MNRQTNNGIEIKIRRKREGKLKKIKKGHSNICLFIFRNLKFHCFKILNF